MGRPRCCDKANVKRGPWTAEEDAKILAHVASHGIGNWTLVPQKAGLNRCGKSCRLRWTNYLRPDLNHDNFTPQEEECIVELHKSFGSRWSLIARQLPGRTDNDVKNYWNTKLKKKLAKMGIDPITHKPFSQLFNEYGKISGIPGTGNLTTFLHNSAGGAGEEISLVEPNTTHISYASQFQVHPFQAIKQETSAQTHFFDEPTSSSDTTLGVMRFGCTPSYSCEQAQFHMATFMAGECFLGDPASAGRDADRMDECKCMEIVSNEGMVRGLIGGAVSMEESEACNESVSAECSLVDSVDATDSTFVDAILAHDSEMKLQFPHILDENVYDY